MTALRSMLPAAALALALVPAIAHGQQQQPRTVRIADRIARNHFENGNEYFRLGRYADAAREFEHAFEISHQNELLYNVAWSYELGGDLPGALQWYQRFEAAGAPGFGLEPLHERIENLRNRMPSSEPSAAPSSNPPSGAMNATPTEQNTGPVQPPPPNGPPQPHYTYRQSTLNTVGPFIAIGIGAVFGGLAVWQGVSYAGDSSALAQVNNQMWTNELTSRYERVGTEGTLTWVFGGVGVAAIAAGIVWIAARGPGERVETTARHGARTTAFLTPVGDGAMAGVGGVF